MSVARFQAKGRDQAVEMPAQVEQTFAGFPSVQRAVLLRVRNLIFELAAEHDVGPLTETLKWGQPSYLTEASKAGTTIRLALDKDVPTVFFNCQTTLVSGFRSDFPEAFEYSGNRALHLAEKFDANALAICLSRALTYHRNKKVART